MPRTAEAPVWLPARAILGDTGIGILCKPIDMSLAGWRRQTAVNLDGVFQSVRYAIPAMRRAGGGSIIITSSVAGLRGSAGLAGYSATKVGVRLFAKAVAMECAADGDGIRVNTVHPGVIDTPIWTKIQGSAGHNGRSTRTRSPELVCRSAGSGKHKTSLTACSFSPPMRRTT
jgi:NAD(P)-dependent dehydrogenase (short-subunit alcohol dehydrogenase family)